MVQWKMGQKTLKAWRENIDLKTVLCSVSATKTYMQGLFRLILVFCCHCLQCNVKPYRQGLFRLILVLCCQRLQYNVMVEAKYIEDKNDVKKLLLTAQWDEFHKFLRRDLPLCSIKSVTLIYDNDAWFKQAWKDYSHYASKQIIHYHIHEVDRDDIKKNLYKIYTHFNFSFFIILMMENANGILEIADEVFQEHKRGKAAAMPHKSKWLVWVYDSALEKRLVQQQEYSHMDNVAFFRLLMNGEKMKDGQQNFEVYTFMWNGNRTRRKELVDTHVAGDDKCALFPNSKHGLNGRYLEVGGVMYLTPNYLNTVTDPETGQPTYEGFRIELLKMIAKDLNFTYNITVNCKVDFHLNELKKKSVDIGLSMWPTNVRYDEMDVTSPVHYDSLRGVYLRPSRPMNHVKWPMFLAVPYFEGICISIPLVILSTSVVWMIIASFKPDCEEKRNQANTPSRTLKRKHHEDDGGKNTTNKLIEFLEIIWFIMASAVHQGNIPDTNRISFRILSCSWFFFMFLFYAMFTGFLTSEMVDTAQEVPFITFDGLLEDEQFEWGTLRDDSKLKELFTNSSNAVLQDLGELLDILDDHDGIEETKQNLFRRLEGPFVLIYYESYISTILHLADYIVIPEALFTMNRGLAIPKDSELNRIISNAIALSHESGTIDRLLAKFNLSLRHNTVEKSKARKQGNRPISLNDTLFLLFTAFILLVCSTVIFVIEILLGLSPMLFFKRQFLHMFHGINP